MQDVQDEEAFGCPRGSPANRCLLSWPSCLSWISCSCFTYPNALRTTENLKQDGQDEQDRQDERQVREALNVYRRAAVIRCKGPRGL